MHSLSRRNFLTASSASALSGVLLPALLTSCTAKSGSNETIQKITGTDTKPIQLTPLQADTEKKDSPLFAPINNSKRLGFAIVGLGHLALGEILPAFARSKYARPVALVSDHPDKARKVGEQYNILEKNIYNYDNFDSIKDNPAIDVVYIVLPNSMHAEYTMRAARAGKHILCEKPMCVTSKEAEQMVNVCKENNRKLMIAYRIQYEPHNVQIKNWIRKSEYGKVKLIEGINVQNQGDPTQWRLKKELAGGGSLRDIGIYCLNTFRFLLGDEPELVSAISYTDASDPRFKEVEEIISFQMKFPGGVLVNSASSYNAHQCRRYRCYTDKGVWFGMDPAFDYKGLKMEISQAKDKMEWTSSPAIEEVDQFAKELDHMAMCVLYDKKPYTPGEEGLQDMRLIEAIEKSAADAKPVIIDPVNKKDAFRGDEPTE